MAAFQYHAFRTDIFAESSWVNSLLYWTSKPCKTNGEVQEHCCGRTSEEQAI